MIIAYQRILYGMGWYRFPAVERAYHCRTEDHWINFINEEGEWLPNEGKIPYLMPEWLRKLRVNLEDNQYYDAGTKLGN